MSASHESVRLTQVRDFQFDITFGPALPALRADEPPPLGQGQGPTPVQLLSAAVGNCLSASLLFALRKYRNEPGPIGCEVQAEVGRNAENRLRVLSMRATITLGDAAVPYQSLERVLASFETFCTVTQSVSQGFPVHVAVVDPRGTVLKAAA